MLLLYQLLFPLFALALAARFLLSGRGRSLAEGRRELAWRLGRLSADDLAPLAGAPVLWVHAASVGEVAAAGPLLRRLPAGRSRVLLTTSTAAGLDRAAALPGVSRAALAPADISPAAGAFLERATPYALVLVETELWPVTLRLASRRGVRVGIANGRLSPGAFARYRWVRGTMRSVLGGVSRAAVQTEEDAARFAALGLSESAILVAGNLKHDLEPPGAAAVERARCALAALGWGRDPVWVAGSTRPAGEEEAVLEAFLTARRDHPRLRLVLAPRHVERAADAGRLAASMGLRVAALSALPSNGPPPDCLLVDSMGLLPALYAAGAAAFVGGTWTPVGGHNVLEPALSGRPVFFGPHTDAIDRPARALESSGGGFRARDAASLGKALSRLLGRPEELARSGAAARATAERFMGATDRTLKHLEPILAP